MGTSLAKRASRARPGRASPGPAVPGWIRRAWIRRAWVPRAWVPRAWVHSARIHSAWIHSAWIHSAWIHGAGVRPARGGRPSSRELATAAVLTVIAVIAAYGEAHPTTPGAYFTGTDHQPHTPNAAFLLVALAGAVLAWRNTHPRLVICVSTAATVAYTVPGNENGVVLLLPAVAIFSLAAQVPAVRSVLWVLGVTVVLMVTTAWHNPLGTFGGAFFLVPANNAVAFFAGLAVANRRAYTDSVRVQSTRQAAQDAQRRVDEERLRIARELHDVVAHTMATITVQAAAAATLLHDRPEEAAQSLRAIRAASKDGLRELHAIVNVLRNDGDGDGDGEPADPTQPTPGLARLDALAAGVRAAGLPVSVRVAGQPRPVPAVTDLAAYRIIQEALTNTLRHAGPATAEVAVDYGPDVLSIEVTDTGRGLTDSAAEAAYAAFAVSSGIPLRAPIAVATELNDQQAGARSGHGLRGMRERAAAAGGTTRRLIATLASRAPVAVPTTRPGPAAASDRARRPLPRHDVSRLTEREREVLSLVAEGLSNDEIAVRLYLSPLTTKTHVSHIMTKLDARDRAQLVVIAYETGMVIPGTAQQ